MTKDNLFHVGIPEQERVRKSLLQTTRATISCLQRFEKFKVVREEKQNAIDEFSHIVKEIYSLDSKLDSILPKVGTKKKPKPAKESSIEHAKKPTPKRQVAKPRRSELEVLEKDLAKIDDALSKLK